MPFLTTEQAEAVAQSTVRIATLVELQLVSGTLRLWNGFGSIRAAGDVWTGAGTIGSISGLSQTRQLVSDKVQLKLAAISTEVQALAVTDRADAEGRSCYIWFQLFDEKWQTLGARIPAFWGTMQRISLERTASTDDSGGVRAVEIEVENAFAARARVPARYYTDQDQQTQYPGDKFFRFVSAQQTDTVIWPDY